MSKRVVAGLVAACVLATVSTGCTSGAQHAGQTSAPQSAGGSTVHRGVAVVSQRLTGEQRAALAPVRKSAVRHANNKNLTDEQVETRFDAIDENYSLGEAFSDADAEFVRAYALPNDEAFDPSALSVSTASTMTANRSGGSGTKLCKFSASMSHSAGLVTGKWSSTVTMSSGSAITKVKITAHPRSYGVIGKSGIGLTYSADPSATTTGHSYSFNRSASYTSVLEAYFTLYNDLTCYYSAGSFVVS